VTGFVKRLDGFKKKPVFLIKIESGSVNIRISDDDDL